MTGWILKLGPVIKNKYEYFIIAIKFKNLIFVRARNIARFDKRYNAEVKKWLKKHASSIRREEHSDQCQYYVPEGFYS